MKIELYNKHPKYKEYFYTELEMPASRYVIHDALHRVRFFDGDTLEFNISECPEFPEIKGMNVDRANIFDLNNYAQLDSKTANSGSANYNKFAAFIDKHFPEFYNFSKNGYDWCDIFNDYCHIKASDMETARKALYQPYESCGAGCTYSAGYFRQNGAFINRGAGMPKPGDQIFFGIPGNEYHTGIVVKVLGDKVYTVEGNSDEKVSEHCYYLTDSSIAGYGRPKYDKEVTTVELKENGAIYKYAYKDVLGGSSKLLKSLKTGAKVTWLKDDGYGWSKVRSGTVEGWIMNRHLKKSGLSKFKGFYLTKEKKATLIEKKKAVGTKTLKKGVGYTLICTIERGKYKGKNYIAVGSARYYI